MSTGTPDPELHPLALKRRLQTYYITAVLSLLFAVIGFSYNAWRMEVSEDNSNIRTAAFEMLNELAGLEQIVYAAHYDQNPQEGNPRQGWVKVGLLHDLSLLVGDGVDARTAALKQTWAQHWPLMAREQSSVDAIVAAIDDVRVQIRLELANLE